MWPQINKSQANVSTSCGRCYRGVEGSLEKHLPFSNSYLLGHSECILVIAQGSIDSGSNHRNVEPETIEAMCNKHCNLTLGSPSVANMLDAMNLAALSSVVQRVQDQAATMLSKWLLLEAIGFIDVNDEGEDLEECQDAVDKGSAALLLLQQLHSVGG